MGGKATQTIATGGQASWDITVVKDSVFIRVTRLDNGGCATLTLEHIEDLGITNADLAGTYNVTMSTGDWTSSKEWRITPSDNGGSIDFGEKSYTYTFSDGNLTCYVFQDTYVEEVDYGSHGSKKQVYQGQDSIMTINFIKENGKITGSGTYLLQALDENNKPTGDAVPYSVTMEKIS